MRPLALLLPLLLITFATSALASDGVLEINQACAVQTGCFAGDGPGYPVFITQSGSYRLTSNLTLPDENTNGIQIEAPAVGLDLGGFAVEGPTVCVASNGPVSSCAPLGTGIGIVGAEFNNGIRIRNGVVRGAGSAGIAVGSTGVIEEVGTFSNGGPGIFASEGVRVESCQSTRNGAAGLQGLANVQVIDCIVELNGSHGVNLSNGSEVRGVHARANGGSGIIVSSASIVRGCSAEANTGVGISTGSGSFSAVIEGNTVSENGPVGILAGEGSTIRGNSVKANQGAGILASGALIQGNSIVGNDGSGIGLPAGSTALSAYRENIIMNNATQAVSLLHVNLGDNYCAGANVASSSCP